MTDIVDRFMNLFISNERSKGVFDPRQKTPGKNMYTLHSKYEKTDFEDHISGKRGIGLVPILDDDTCWWGAIDIDCHGDAKEIDLYELEKEVRSKDLPLMVCRSKSGGAHLYLFCSEAVPARLVRKVLAKWASELHFTGAEVFPKQDKLLKDKEGQQLGNWINICNFDAYSEGALRWCVEGGKRISIEYFVEIAESRRVTAQVLVEKSEGNHDGAPPCICAMISNGIAPGYRNEALYNICIYLKQAYPETWKDKAFDLNAKIFSTPLPYSEAKKTITSVGRRTYRYKCGEEPCRSLCNSSVCVNRKFGITKEEHTTMNLGEHPKFTGLKKYLTDPVRWGLEMDGGFELNLTTQDIMDYKKVREAVAEKLTRIIPPMKADKWLAILQTLMNEAVLVDAPEDASSHGLIWSHLRTFLQRADMTSTGENTEDRKMLLRGIPVVQLKNEKKLIYFRGSDFVNYLRKNRAEELRGPNLWFALRQHGVTHTSLRIGSVVRDVWAVEMDKIEQPKMEGKKIEPEF